MALNRIMGVWNGVFVNLCSLLVIYWFLRQVSEVKIDVRPTHRTLFLKMELYKPCKGKTQ